MGEMDWLEQGHGRGDGLQPMIKGPSHDAADRVSIRRVLRGGESPSPRKSRRRTKALAGWLIYCCIAVGGTAAAFTVRDTLFPSLGAPTAQVLWAAPVETNNEHGSIFTAVTVTTLDDLALGAADVGVTAVVATPVESVDAQTVPSAPSPNQGPANSVDNRGGEGVVTATGTTLADDPSNGQGPGTTIVGDPTGSSTPASASTPPTSADTSSSTPTTPASGDGQHGKGGGNGGGGNGPPPPTP